MEVPESLRALRSPVFRRYYYGQAVSMIGTWVQSVATMWLAYRLTGSTVYTGLVGFLMGTPHLLLAPFAGVLGDRVNRRKLLIAVRMEQPIPPPPMTPLPDEGVQPSPTGEGDPQ